MNSYLKISLLVLFSFLFMFSGCKKKSEILIKEWKATEMEFAGTKLTSEETSISYNFKADGSFERTEDGKTEEGKWQINDDGTKITLEYPEEHRKIVKEISELSDNMLIITGEEHTMIRKETLIPKGEEKE